ncbi:sodium-dependent phosphate transport 2B-like [Brachionus plicatilis]|uniref:Sodium-dependent phosphate transport 2B-like n=1 Tax=Brachionus plicatilis TaxID=10195 RepID=A0A3M7PD16_BRAPC|nr:sodium-dependent phosphate transport 2B-like [Brachionus plicatilis]
MDNPAFYPDEISAPAIAQTNEISRKFSDQIEDQNAHNSLQHFDKIKKKIECENNWQNDQIEVTFLTIGFTLISPLALKAGKAVSFLLQNPFGSLAIGIMATAIMQNATATTSIVVTMVGAGIIPSVKSAVPIIMGSNIGTCLTNIFIALTLSGDPYEFKRAFSAAAINDLFNILTTAVLLPIEIFFNLLSFLSQKLTELMPNDADEFKHMNFVAAILDPVVDLFILLDQDQINAVNMGSNTTKIALRCCGTDNGNETNARLCKECDYWCMPMLNSFGDGGTGLFWIIFSLVVHLTCLFGIVKIFSQLIEGPIAHGIRKIMNASLPGKWKVFNNLLLFVFSFALTLVVQSLDIITATLVPLCGIGIVSLRRAYVMTLGSNIGTTVTGILIALTQPGANFKKSLEIAFVYTLFNVFGTFFWLPIPFLRFPKTLAQKFGNVIFNYQWLTYVYAALVYFIIPTIVFSLALIPYWIGLAILIIPIVFLILNYLVIVILRKLVPQKLPEKLKSFVWLPRWIRSLDYWDSIIKNIKLWKPSNASRYSIESKESSQQDINEEEGEQSTNLPSIVRKFSAIESIIRESKNFGHHSKIYSDV